MDPSRRLDDLIAPLRAEVRSGASTVAAMAADALAQGAADAAGGSVAELRAAIADLGVRILDAQPAMAPLVTLAGAVLDAIAGAEDVPGARVAAREAAEAFRQGMAARARELAERTAELLADGDVILTLSSSAAVRDALVQGARGRRVEAIVLESRPLLEGRRMAAELARAGIPVTVAADAAAVALARRSSRVLLGADSVGDLGVVNKLGSAALALAARRAGIPVVVSADCTKLLPPGFPQDVADDRPAHEILQATAGVAVWNRYFEVVPMEDVTTVVTDVGAFASDDLTRQRAGIRIPAELRSWAERKRREQPEKRIR